MNQLRIRRQLPGRAITTYEPLPLPGGRRIVVIKLGEQAFVEANKRLFGQLLSRFGTRLCTDRGFGILALENTQEPLSVYL